VRKQKTDKGNVSETLEKKRERNAGTEKEFFLLNQLFSEKQLIKRKK